MLLGKSQTRKLLFRSQLSSIRPLNIETRLEPRWQRISAWQLTSARYPLPVQYKSTSQVTFTLAHWRKRLPAYAYISVNEREGLTHFIEEGLNEDDKIVSYEIVSI